MTCFADTSAVVKLYADETGQAEVLAAERFGLVVSDLVRVELPATLWKKHRMGEVADHDVRVLLDQFNADFHGTRSTVPRWSKVAVTGLILDRAAVIAGSHGLRAYDSVQLATALAVRILDPGLDRFICFDKDLNRAAAAEGFDLVVS